MTLSGAVCRQIRVRSDYILSFVSWFVPFFVLDLLSSTTVGLLIGPAVLIPLVVIIAAYAHARCLEVGFWKSAWHCVCAVGIVGVCFLFGQLVLGRYGLGVL